MFTKILIANRGEIACRVIETAHRMGVATVAVYSDADRTARHVQMAGEAVHIGPAPVGESYLKGDVILEAAKATGAEAIHPGYGFLSENPDFVEAVEKAGLTFIGPSAKSIRAMGLKDAAKALMEKAGVPVVPGYHGDNQDPAFLAEQAEAIGYPVLIKARAGGGGKGMRKVDTAAGFAEGLASAQREGQASFGDPHVLIEKYITAPRHIEVQVFGDHHGNAVHLFERDCSLQRRHQKVMEEAPAPGMTAKMRAAMTEAAVTAAKAIDYSGAGTIEFIADGSGALRPDGFWFMQMNTRLQVEHPVTEAVTGFDLVEWQLRVASGEPLPATQADIHLKGHAFEARLYAEDAANDFLPVTGHLSHLSFGPGRIDTGVRPGDDISPHYDPMIAKIIVHGADRHEALARLRVALGQTHVAGTVTNSAFLAALAAHEGFGRGEVDTGLVARDLEALTAVPELPEAAVGFAAIVALGLDLEAPMTGWRLFGPARHQLALVADDARLQRTVLLDGASLTLEGGGTSVRLDAVRHEGTRLTATIDGHTQSADCVAYKGPDGAKHVSVLMDGHSFVFAVPDPLEIGAAGDDGDTAILSPMTGVVRVVAVAAGHSVKAGDRLVVIEAMKMEHVLKAPRDAEIAEVLCAEGGSVESGALLVRLAEPEAD